MSKKSDQTTTRSANRKQILNSLRQLGPLSRSQLVELTGLSGAAMTFVTADLLEERLLIEHELGETTPKGGRKPVLLDINYQGHYSIGVNLTEQQIEVVLTNLQTVVLDHELLDLESKISNHVFAKIELAIKSLLKRQKIEPLYINGVGIAMGGIIDVENGICSNSTILGWHNVAVVAELEKRLGLPVWLDNDINAFANAERLFGAGKQANTFLAVTVGRGIGAALIVGGQIHTGRHSGVGSFGHTIIQPNGRLCECGRYGCLEAYASEPALVAQYNEQSLTQINSTQLLELIEQNNPKALVLLKETAVQIGRSIAAVVNLLDPELVVLGGEGLRFGQVFVDTISLSIRQFAFAELANDIPIEIALDSLHSRTPWARGAASLAIQLAFDKGALPIQNETMKRS